MKEFRVLNHRSVAEFGAPAMIYPSGDKIELTQDKQFIKAFFETRSGYYASNESLAFSSGVLWMACGVWVERFSPGIIQNDEMMRSIWEGQFATNG